MFQRPVQCLIAMLILSAWGLSGCIEPTAGRRPVVAAPQATPGTPSSAGNYAEAAKQFVLKNQYDDAIREGTQAVTVDPNWPFGWYWLAKAYYEKKQFDQAIPRFQKVIDLRPATPEWQWAVVYAESHLGWAYYVTGQYDEAIRHFTLSIERDPATEGVFEGRGRAYLARKDYDLALRDLIKAEESGKFLVRVFYFKGLAQFYKGNFYEALTDFKKGMQSQDAALKDWIASYARYKALCYLGLGDAETAAVLVRDAIDIPEGEKPRILALIAYRGGTERRP